MEKGQNTYAPLGIGSGSLIAGRYEIDIKLGAGATSAVYRARDKSLNNSICAIKIIDTKNMDSASDLERFRNEVLVTRKLTHPNIVRTFEFGQTNSGQLFITMEYIAGKSLDSLLEASKNEGLMPIAEVLYYLKVIATGLESAHEANVIHRDLKPANILVSTQGEVKIADFGLAKQTELDLKLTTEGECVGTPAYMSPEQLQGFKIDHRSDIYSFGVLAFELLTGDLPFSGKDWFSLGRSIVVDPLPEINAQKQRVPVWLCQLVKSCCMKKADDRPQNFREVIEIIESRQSELAEEDHQTRFIDKITSTLVWTKENLPIVKFAPFLLIVCIAIFILILMVERGSKSAEKINQKVATSEKKVGSIIETMNKGIYVLQKFEQKGEVIDKLYEKMSKEEANSASEATTAPAEQKAPAPEAPQAENK